MRVNVRDETMENLSSLFGDLINLTARLGDILRQGIRISDTCYDYLASSNSQLRNHSCWFIEEDGKGEDRRAHTIRRGIGNLDSKLLCIFINPTMGNSNHNRLYCFYFLKFPLESLYFLD